MGKIIVLTASTGGGHDKAADNLRILLTESGHQVQVTQFMKEINRSLDYVVVNSYKQMSLRSPRTFGTLYHMSNNRRMNKQLSLALKIVGKQKLLKHINDYEPDLIIGTHLLASTIICSLKKSQKIQTTYLSVVTDFYPHLSYIDPAVNAYLVGSDITKNILIQNGIKSEIIFNYGMPLTRSFYTLSKRTSDLPTLLMMGGSIGLSFIDDLLKALSVSDLNCKCIVVCGKNKHLKHHVEQKYTKYSNLNLTVLGFTDEIDVLMDCSDVIITKPGGLTASEAIAKELPLLIPFAMPGQEEENTDFLMNHGAALKISNGQQLTFILHQLIDNPSWYQSFIKNLRNIKASYDVDMTIDLVNDIVTGKY